jgi:hypothetical protein
MRNLKNNHPISYIDVLENKGWKWVCVNEHQFMMMTVQSSWVGLLTDASEAQSLQVFHGEFLLSRESMKVIEIEYQPFKIAAQGDSGGHWSRNEWFARVPVWHLQALTMLSRKALSHDINRDRTCHYCQWMEATSMNLSVGICRYVKK